jgi:hypothetical protein
MEKSPETSDEISQPAAHRTSTVGETLKFDGDVQDLGAELFLEIQGYSADELEAESAKVRRLIDWHIMPIVGHHSKWGWVTC